MLVETVLSTNGSPKRFWPKMIRGTDRSIRVLRRASSPSELRGVLIRDEWPTSPPKNSVLESRLFYRNFAGQKISSTNGQTPFSTAPTNGSSLRSMPLPRRLRQMLAEPYPVVDISVD